MNLREREASRHEKEEQIRVIIERYNNLELAFRDVEKACSDRNRQVQISGDLIFADMKSVREMLDRIMFLMDKLEKERVSLSKEFKKIIKIDAQKRLERRVDQLKYEEYISKDELYRLLERYKKN